MSVLDAIIRQNIATFGPMNVASFMNLALAHPQHGYYMHRDPFGAQGDFTTAPEISQMFGELLGLWAADVWIKLGRPDPFQLVEAGPGRGTLMADALRAGATVPGFREAAQIVLIETSPVLTEKQKQTLDSVAVQWVDDLKNPVIQSSSAPIILLANEFLDALPVRQLEWHDGAWRERLIMQDDSGQLRFTHGDDPVAAPHAGSPGEIYEISPARADFVGNVATLLKARGGAALFIDYGYDEPSTGDTLQAVKDHHAVSALDYIGDADLTAHVDFSAVTEAARAAGCAVRGPVGQGDFLRRLGIEARADKLLAAAKTAPQRATIVAALPRLTAPEQMGRLFRVLAICGDAALMPDGF